MIKHHWEVKVKIEEEEPKKPKWEFTARDAEDITVGCFAFLFGIAMLVLGILLIYALFTVKL